MVQAPTGAGKTVLAAAIVDGALAKGKRVLFTVPFLSLVDQTVAALAAQGIASVGVMQGYHPMTDARSAGTGGFGADVAAPQAAQGRHRHRGRSASLVSLLWRVDGKA